MRTIAYLLFLLILFVSCNTDKTIRIHLKSDDDITKEYTFYQSVGGNFLGHKSTAYLNGKNEDILELSPDNCSVQVIYGGLRAQLYLSPGDEVFVDFNILDKKNKYLKFEGDNAAGHDFYNQLRKGEEFYGFSDLGILAFKETKSYERALQKIAKKEKVELDQLNSLLRDAKISKGYYDLCKVSINIYYRLADSYVLWQDGDNWYDKDWNVVKSIDTANRIRDSYNSIQQKFEEEVISGVHSEYYWWWLHDRGWMKTKLSMNDISDYISGGYYNGFRMVRESLRPNEDKEDALALMLMADYTVLQQRDRMVMRNYLDFVNEFPESKYNGILASYHKQYVDYYDKIDKTKIDGFTFVTDYESIKRFSILEELSKGKVMYVDIWATWCGPCIEEFGKSAEFWEFAKRNNVDLMFVSLDEVGLKDKWKEAIKFYNLQGLNLMASKSLASDIHHKFGLGQDKTLAIPRYMILKDGKVVEANANRPSSKEKLTHQIKQYL